MGQSDNMIQHDAMIRGLFFLCVLFAMAVWEHKKPLRAWSTPITRRWFDNLGIVAINSAALRLLFPGAAAAVGYVAQSHGWGLLNIADLPAPVEFVIALIALDLAIYCQHVLFHAIPLLWRLHMVHHTDLDFDVTTGVRFHPFEILLSLLIKASAIIMMGATPLAIIAFEIVLNATSMFNHSNIKLPAQVDAILRLFLVTPDMHRVHHSIFKQETNSNFGFNLPWWDRLFGTYRDQPQSDHLEMKIGLLEYRDAALLHLGAMLALPFRARIGDYAITGGEDP